MSSSGSGRQQRCARCKNSLPLEDFPFRRGSTDTRTSTCAPCAEAKRVNARANYKPKHGGKENTQPAAHIHGRDASSDGDLSNLDLEQLLGLLRAQPASVGLEVRVDATQVPGVGRQKADGLAHLIWEVWDYRFIYHSKYDHQDIGSKAGTTRHMYHCAQNAARQHAPKKTASKDRQRDKESMQAFECRGWLHITVSDTDPDKPVFIKLDHGDAHVPYCPIDIPADVKEYVKNNPNVALPALWNEILKKHPQPCFTRKAIYSLWSQMHKSSWTRAEDEVESASVLLEEARQPGAHGIYTAEPIPLEPEAGATAIAFALPDILRKWGGRVREIQLDSAWNTGGTHFEVYALLREFYGSGCPLAYLLVQTRADSTAGAKERLIGQLLEHIRDNWHICPIITLTDKDWSEINAFRAKFPTAKHQLCFWHCLRAIRKRLSILRRAPAFYDVDEAVKEFPYIDRNFVPVSQLSETAEPPPPPMPTALPQLTIRLNGTLQILSAPEREKLVIRLKPLPRRPLEPDLGAAKLPTTEADAPPDEDTDVDGDEDDFDAQVARFISDGRDTDDEDGPDWMFEDGEKRSADPEYVFCPAPHRKQLLRLFTRHFCQHPLFPERDGTFTAAQIRERAVEEMYKFCRQRHLREVWGYLWTSWYAPKKWAIWARSTSAFVSRHRTTMGTENFWRQLKHNYLHHFLRPRLDHLVWILLYNVTPAYVQHSAVLEDTHRLGRSKPLTNFQRYFKTGWNILAKRSLSEKDYKVDVANWTCHCGQQKYDRHHLCKHLVQAVPPPPAEFFRRVYRRRTAPLYRDPVLVPKTQAGELPVLVNFVDADDGSITDGDDHVWTGDSAVLQGSGGWSDFDIGAMLQRKRSATSLASDDEGVVRHGFEPSSCAEDDGSTSDDGENAEVDQLVQALSAKADAFAEAARIIRSQLQHRNAIWLRSLARRDLGADVEGLVHDIQVFEASGRKRRTTWARARDAQDQRRVQNTMAYRSRLEEDDD